MFAFSMLELSELSPLIFRAITKTCRKQPRFDFFYCIVGFVQLLIIFLCLTFLLVFFNSLYDDFFSLFLCSCVFICSRFDHLSTWLSILYSPSFRDSYFNSERFHKNVFSSQLDRFMCVGLMIWSYKNLYWEIKKKKDCCCQFVFLSREWRNT